MLSLSGVTGRTAAAYYEKDDYYFRQSGTGEVIAGHERTGRYVLNLQDFQALVLERTERITANTRLADDLTFSAPKSVSLLVALDDRHREEIINAHQEAVQSVVKYMIESGMVQARDAEGNPCAVKKDSVVALRFEHFLSRNLDPQLHSHVLLVNSVVRSEDGKVVSAYLREIYTNKKSLGAVYRQELASRLERLGYQIEWKKDGTFEVAGFTKEQLKTFSSRREEILQRLEELKQQGIEGGKANEIACKDTRRAKEEVVNPLALRVVWEERAKEAGITRLPEPIKVEKDSVKEAVREKDLRTIAEEVVNKQLRTAGFTINHRLELEIAREASKTGITTNIQEIRQVARSAFFEIARKYGERLELDTDRIGRKRFTVGNIAKADTKTEVVGLRDNQQALTREKAEKVLNRFCERLQKEKGFTLSEAQRKMVLGVATSTNDVVVIGRAGAGKTTAMQALKKIYESQGKTVIGVSFTGAAAKNLERETEIKSFTIDSLAVRNGFGKFEKQVGSEKLQGGLIVVDEAGMVSADRAAVIQEIADKYQMKIVWVGDPSQTKPVLFGDPYTRFLNKAREKGALYELSEIHRQKDPEYRQAVYAAAAGNFKKALQILQNKGWLHEMNTKNEMIQFARQEYMKALQEGKSILVLADTNKLVERLNSEIRYDLKQAGLIEKEGIETLVKDTAGKVVGEKEFVKGDTVMFLRNSSELQVKNGQLGKVVEVDKENRVLTIEMKDGSIKTVELDRYNYLMHGYAMTVHKSQGQTVDRVVYLAEPKHITENRAYVAISRAREECQFLAKDLNEILQKLEPENKVDIAGWVNGRVTERDLERENSPYTEKDLGKLKDISVDIKDYNAAEDVKQTILDSAGRETWYSLSQEEKELLVKGDLDSKVLEEKTEQAIEKAGEWHPDEEKAEKKEVMENFKKEYLSEEKLEEDKKFEKEEEKKEEKEISELAEVSLEEEKGNLAEISIDEELEKLQKEEQEKQEEQIEQIEQEEEKEVEMDFFTAS